MSWWSWAMFALGCVAGFTAAGSAFDRLVRRDPLWWRGLVTAVVATAVAGAVWLNVR